ncbi:hypothetical protein BOTBODRAFT_153368 [Botryobasidium botryosum FD-172 SS1]|uniref:Cyanovirin-N domain-containing protein n=1 Tax=Botryobasidium botryosum (strain FD-172 SS1) TaxID=930990 RepID=A0A067MUP0_BOTB1|nr:hypothetical protein BOTBODRAFT_153368 [Botryobasidium botryosum FD-172 SS1]
MSFVESSRDVHLDLDSVVLRAACQNEDGEWNESAFYLNQVLGNIDGEFEWDEENFSFSAENIRLEGDTLFASLQRADGEWNHEARIRLGDRIRNINGELVFE